MIRQPVDGRSELGEPVLSQCDVEALAFVFAWVLEGSEPYPPGERPYSAHSTDGLGGRRPGRAWPLG
jgi:hypothetical protein